MAKKRYHIKRFYQARTSYHHWDDTELEDEWQLEVYLHALGLMKKNNFNSIVDIGCGSAYKLMTYFNEHETLGIEIKETFDFLKKTYPDKDWLEAGSDATKNLTTDVVICSDVIEHLVDPDELLDFIKSISAKYIILSTPDRSLVYQKWKRYSLAFLCQGFWGPPANEAHLREWAFKEFYNYISEQFDVVDHRVTNLAQATQMIICHLKK